jgi:hypothetical protein
MANTKISELSALGGDNLQDVDLLPIVDLDGNNDGDTTDKVTKSITVGDLKTGLFESPSLTGTPLAPTATASTNNTQIATTEFVTTAVASNSFTLPVASASTLGGIKVGTNLSIDSNGVLSASAAGGGGSSTFADLTDTTITSIGDGEIILYDNASSKYVNKTLAEAGIASVASPAFTGNPTAPTPTANTHIATKDYVDSQFSDSVGNTILVKKVTGAQMMAMSTSESDYITMVAAQGAGKFIVVREVELYIDRGSWSPMDSGNVRGFGDDVQLVIENPASGQPNFKWNTFAVFQKKILNHQINSVYSTSTAVDTILVRDAPVTQTRAYANVPLLLRPKSADTLGQLSTYSQTVDDDYYFRISYRVMDLTSHFTET